MALMKTWPASSSLTKRDCSRVLLVQTLAPKPKFVSLASRIASSISETMNTDATGPNSSSRYAGESAGMSMRTVGG